MKKLVKLGIVAGALAIGGCESSDINPGYDTLTAADSVIINMTKDLGKGTYLRDIKAEICAQQGCKFQEFEKHANNSSMIHYSSVGEAQEHLRQHGREPLPLNAAQKSKFEEVMKYNAKVREYEGK